ncbi:hypothetical protein [Phenylobacterium hankyongense]|uniref:hypothetical protein n=1 Tax=Phenylobacterium hankyongense TaxID=1813876 RepID=UPI001401F688|nr:hypothetical protein [Phenylobacterium hankyongense]
MDYRAYLLSPAGGILAARDLEADSDAEALDAAAAIRHPHAIEVWRRAERIGCVQGGED